MIVRRLWISMQDLIRLCSALDECLFDISVVQKPKADRDFFFFKTRYSQMSHPEPYSCEVGESMSGIRYENGAGCNP